MWVSRKCFQLPQRQELAESESMPGFFWSIRKSILHIFHSFFFFFNFLPQKRQLPFRAGISLQGSRRWSILLHDFMKLILLQKQMLCALARQHKQKQLGLGPGTDMQLWIPKDGSRLRFSFFFSSFIVFLWIQTLSFILNFSKIFFKHCGLRDVWGFFFNMCDFLIEKVVAGKDWRMKCWLADDNQCDNRLL